MSELKYWTGNLVTGDDIFYVRDGGVLSQAIVTGVTDTTFFISGTDTPFDKLTARNPEGLSALPYDAEHRDDYFCQLQRMRLAAMNMEALSDNQVAYMLGGLNVAGGAHAQFGLKHKRREKLKAIDIQALSDTEVAYMLAGLKLAEKSERVNRNENHHSICDAK
ncbi:hypothetical protein J7S78_13865 [Klebsiella oxytoca]|uniref:Uncharacterized protein n=1 Tax=Klebsiella oxytoca TaxID=571 RepID=A0AAP2FJP6_KLEOX|nr:hypothetical protein [Klebsiella oxytoca]MBQ0600880.1 hypothetical protein [Klebsiella oxytoca]